MLPEPKPINFFTPFGIAQGGESFDLAQDREPIERPVEPRISFTSGDLARQD